MSNWEVRYVVPLHNVQIEEIEKLWSVFVYKG